MSYRTMHVELIDWWPKENRDGVGGDRDIANAAWASTYDRARAEQRPDKDVERVVKQVVEQAHDTPKEGVWMKFFLTIPIAVERQLDKYRMSVQSQDFQIEWLEGAFGRHGVTQSELSGRYRTIPERHYPMPYDVRDILTLSYVDGTLAAAVDGYEEILSKQHEWYQAVLDSFPREWRKWDHPRNREYKRAREVLRMVLGTAYMTDMRLTLNLNAFEHIMNQRLEPGTQRETRYVVKKMLQEALDAGVAGTALTQMVATKRWEDWCQDIPGPALTWGSPQANSQPVPAPAPEATDPGPLSPRQRELWDLLREEAPQGFTARELAERTRRRPEPVRRDLRLLLGKEVVQRRDGVFYVE